MKAWIKGAIIGLVLSILYYAGFFGLVNEIPRIIRRTFFEGPYSSYTVAIILETTLILIGAILFIIIGAIIGWIIGKIKEKKNETNNQPR